MSDPVTTAEVEDVLSSIRRLVSEEKRPMPAPEQAAPTDRLVLTPALRVEDEEPAAVETQDIQAAFRSERGAEPEMAEPEASPQEPEVAGGETTPDAASPAEMAEDYSQDPYQFDEAPGEEITPDLPPLTLEPEARSDAAWDADALAEAEALAESAQFAPVAGKESGEARAASLSAKIEALETAIGGIEDNFEPDDVSNDAYSGTAAPAMSWEDDAAELDDGGDLDMAAGAVSLDLQGADITPADVEVADDIVQDTLKEISDPIEDTVFTAAAAAAAQAERAQDTIDLASENKGLDEEALRDMVSEIVRSELQGALGERITRNVRKLVRREIHRALTSQDLE